MSNHKHYGIVSDIAEGEPDGAEGSLSIAAVFADSVHSPASVVIVGSPSTSKINLAQLCLTAEQAIQLGALLSAAGADALEADQAVDRLRKYGAAAARLCFALADADAHDVLVDQSRVRLGCPSEAQQIAESAYDKSRTDGDRRAAWREAGERLRRGAVTP